MKTVLMVLLAVLLLGGLWFAARERCSGKEGGNAMNAQADVSHSAEDRNSAGRRLNHLAKETSPYLLQHARNPVDWYPWGKEALGRAKRENKPIFLSIGYSACHWCHVMERESFQDPETAKILNRHFIAIKVDREERPDVDEIYMTAVQAMTGRGGWPLNVFLTPDLKPFFGGTYFPPEDRQGMPSFKKVLGQVAEAWQTRPEDLVEGAEQMAKLLRGSVEPTASGPGKLDEAVLAQAVEELRRGFDPKWGGFGGPPKFPPSGAIALLLRQQRHVGDAGLLKMATVTLDRMARGGMFDQLGGGFHRYSVDAQWLVPHFEKMLYDNAILSRVYLEAWQATHQELYRRTAVAILDYVLRDMTDPRGGFHSSEDADSEGVEGKFYVWRPEEIEDVLGEEDVALFCEYYGVSTQGNFDGHNILHVPSDPQAFLQRAGVSPAEFHREMGQLRGRLLAVRDRRIRPAKDDKVLTAWNGMMISALARGYQVVGDPRYLGAAERAADFVLAEMTCDGRLLRTYRGSGGSDARGVAKLPGYLDDYAEMAAGLVDLYEAGFDRRWLQAADRLAATMIAEFWDEPDGGFFYTSAAHKNLLVRTKPFFDGAVPSGNAAATLVLLRLAKLLDNEAYFQKAERVLTVMSGRLPDSPRAYLDLLRAADFYLHPPREIAIVGGRDDRHTRLLLQTVHERFLPNKVLALLDPGSADAEAVQEQIPLLAGKTMISEKATAYVCENYACKRPVHDKAALEAILTGDSPLPANAAAPPAP